MRSGWSLRAYLVSLVLGVTLPLVALLGYFVYRDAASNAKRAAAAVSVTAARTANHVSRFLADNNLGLEILERRQALRLLDPVHCRSAMRDFIASNPHYANVVVRDRDGNLVCAARHDTQVPKFSPDRELFEQAIRENRFVVSKPYLGRSTGRWVLLLWQPVNDDKGRVMGVIAAGVDLVNFKFTITDSDTPAQTMTRIVDAGGTVIASSYDPGHWVGRNVRDAAIVRLMLAQKQGEARAAGIDGSERIFGFTSIPGTDWFVSTGVPVEVVFDEMRRDLLRIMLATAAILALISAFSYRFMRAITVPMKSIAITAGAVAAGDFDARARSGGPREVTAIATQFNAMLDSQILTYRQLRESEEGLRQRALIFENATDAIMILDLQRRITDWNPASERLLGYRKHEVLGRTTEFLYRPEDYAIYTPLINETIARGERWVMERVMLCKDGTERICETIRAPLLDAGGTLIGRLGLSRDITERKQAEEARARLAAIVEHSNDAIIGRGRDRKIISWNAAAERILGFTAAEAIGRDLVTNFPPDLLHEAAEIRRLVGTGVLVPYFETVRMTKDGRRIDVGLSVSPIRDNSGNIIGTASILRDITERRQAERAVRAAHTRLRELTAHMQSAIESERARIARDVHDSLGGALTGLSMDLAWCIKQLRPARVKRDTLERLRVMAGQAGDAMQEVRRIITDLRPSILDHLGLWAALDWLAQNFAERNSVPCRIRHAGTRRIGVSPDCATAVFRIVQEALTNVARHAYAAHVMIRIGNEGDEMVIKVIDDGKGMPPERLAGPGSYGILGMQERAAIFGGSVKVTGVRAVGTSVELRLPLAAALVTEEH